MGKAHESGPGTETSFPFGKEMGKEVRDGNMISVLVRFVKISWVQLHQWIDIFNLLLIKKSA
jgi:hypothetical protein